MYKTLKQHIRNLAEKVTDAPATEPKQSSDKAAAAITRPKAPIAEAQVPVDKRKGLLQGVRLK